MNNTIFKLKNQLIEQLQGVLSFDTTKNQPAEANAPFGKNIAECLEHTLKLGENLGFASYNCDGYAGHIEYGQGEQIVGILGHLDVVPCGEGWTYPPFEAQIHNNCIYARGAMDDKGPSIAALYAMYALKLEGFVPSKRIRLILGCDEESGMGCMSYYKTKQTLPTIAFSPDGDFPVINVEKGIFQMMVNLGKLDENILSIHCGTRLNIVPNSCVAVIKNNIDTQILDVNKVNYTNNGDTLTLSFAGKNAHASTPEQGVNASWKCFKILSQLFPYDLTLDYLATKLCKDTNGVAWNIPYKDDVSGSITHNIGTVNIDDNGNLIVGIDIRFPASYHSQQINERLNTILPAAATYTARIDEPLLVDANSQLVTLLLASYEKVTGKQGYPIAIGGGTYSRMMPCCVAFGPLFPSDENVIHMPDEYIEIDKLMLMTEIYYEAIKQLSK